jgi:hypothetical protein
LVERHLKQMERNIESKLQKQQKEDTSASAKKGLKKPTTITSKGSSSSFKI